MKVSECMSTSLAIVKESDSIVDVAKVMKQSQTGFLPVSKDGSPNNIIGVVTDRDICLRAVAAGLDLNKTEVGKIISKELFSIQSNKSLRDAAEMMKNHKVRRLLVFDTAQNKLVGIFTLGDLSLSTGDDKLFGETLKSISAAPSTKA